jgi:hypothetical protein
MEPLIVEMNQAVTKPGARDVFADRASTKSAQRAAASTM